MDDERIDLLSDRGAWSAAGCSVAAALEVIGTRSAMLILREAFYGTQRFEDFTRRTGFTDAIASARLRGLVQAGVLYRRPYREIGQRTRYEYKLTPKGLDLRPVLLSLMAWGDRWLSDPPGGPISLRHRGCGAPVGVQVRCTQGHEVSAHQTTVLAGPAFPGQPGTPGRRNPPWPNSYRVSPSNAGRADHGPATQ